MNSLSIGNIVLYKDKEQTRKAHKLLYFPCSCLYCRNFAAASAYLPTWYNSLLEELGIDATKPAEIIEYTENKDGSHFYSWWFHFVGGFVDQQPERAEATINGIQITISRSVDLVETHFPGPILQIEFFADIPWILDEEPGRAS